MTKVHVWIKIALGVIFLAALGFWLAPYLAGEKTISPILWQWGSLTVHWYGFLITISILTGFYLVQRWLAPARGISSEHVTNLFLWATASGLLGARSVFVVLKWSDYANNLNEIFMFNHGGLSIHGAILFGAFGVFIYTRLAKLNFWRMTDVLILPVILGQAIGRFGNFINQEAFGGPTDLPWKMFVDPAFRPPGLENAAYFHPTFLYESLFALLILIALTWIFYKKPYAGSVLGWYLVLYSGLRFVMEFFRIDSDMWGVLTVAQWASLALIAVGAYILYIRRRRIA